MTESEISLREYFEKILAERDKAAIAVQAEIARRLEDLNHSAKRLADLQASSVSRETWDDFRKGDDTWKSQIIGDHVSRRDYLLWQEKVNGDLSTATGRSQGIAMIGGIIFSIILAVITLVVGVIHH